MSKEELRHCPKCGAPAKVRYEMPMTWVQCKKCKLTSSRFPDYEEQRDPYARQLAIEDWNTMELAEEN